MRRLRRKYEKPLKRWDKARIEREKELMKKYGLRRKKEVWKAESIARKYRRIARKLIAKPDKDEERKILEKIRKYGFIDATKLDDLLNLTAEHILERRLQTIVYKKGLANTIKQARQLIVHGHIAIDNRKVKFPSYLVKKEEEDKISLLLDPNKIGLKSVRNKS
ncbi:MAG: 30S ribosomal protein S4 [Candidatus Aenigmarchaeota archaeon]|nr:30S ribosomal protein S4 [Candidatus Aenigmarchaeota archaeon]